MIVFAITSGTSGDCTELVLAALDRPLVADCPNVVAIKRSEPPASPASRRFRAVQRSVVVTDR